MKDKRKQEEEIVDYIRRNGSATIRDLFVDLNCNSPWKRISELNKRGMIRKEMCSRTNSSGETVRFVRYYLEEVKA